jgi:methylthioribose-1-phosphate isomerase
VIRTVEWHEGRVRLIDQRRLPWSLAYLELSDYREVAQAISDGAVRGAQALARQALLAWRWRRSKRRRSTSAVFLNT